MFFWRLKKAASTVYSSGQGNAGDEKPDEKQSNTNLFSLTEIRKHPALHPIHVKQSISLLSTAEVGETPVNQKIDFRGILNLFFILLFILNIRLVIENIIRYGPLIQLPRVGLFDSPLIFLGYVLVSGLPYLTFVTERYVAFRNRNLAHAIHAVVILGALLFPYLIVAGSPVHPIRSLGLLLVSMVYAMKIGSYWHVCSDLYYLHKDDKLKLVPKQETDDRNQRSVEAEILELSKSYPKCLTASQMYMFVAYPTLVFQLIYPRTQCVRIRVVLRYLAELVFCLVLQVFIIEQYMTPLLNNTISGIESRIQQNGSIPSMLWFLLERFLKLSIPNLYIWLLMFAVFFHCYLNVLAELTRFADRKFYLDWWNAVSIRDYWQKWNQPVHAWLLRHLYKPLRKLGFAGENAAMVVFITSGLIHEYLIITPIGVRWNGLVTLGFVLQIPLIIVTDSQYIKDRPTVGNCMFWITSCFTGQPLATLTHFVAASSPTIFLSIIHWALWGSSSISQHSEL